MIMLLTSAWQVDTSGPDPFYKGPLIFPLIVFCLMIAGSLPSLWRLFKPSQSSWYLDGQGKPFKTMVILCLLICYLAGIICIGLEVSTWLFLLVSLKLVNQDSILKLTLIPVLVTLVLFIIFKYFLDLWFPEPLIMELFLE